MSSYRWNYSLNPATHVRAGDYIEIRDMSGIVAADVEWAGMPYRNPMSAQWDSTVMSSTVTWTHTRGNLPANHDHAHFSYWSTDGLPAIPLPFYRDGIYQGDTAAMPEPASMLLFASALGVLFLRRRMSGDGTSLRGMWRSPRDRGASALARGGVRSAGD